MAAAPLDPNQVEDKRGGCASRSPFRSRISVAAVPADTHFRVEDKRGGCTISMAAAPPNPIQVEDKRGGCTISVAAVLQTPIRLWISVAAAPPDPHSGLG